MASLYNIHVRTGCFCNTGACQALIGITNQQMKRNLQVGDGGKLKWLFRVCTDFKKHDAL